MKTPIVGLIFFFGLNACGIISGQENADAIKNKHALTLYQQALEEDAKGRTGFANAIELLDKADNLEPENALILHERGLIKIHSKIDVEGGFHDLQQSIDFSKDEEGKQIRYLNRGISYMEIGEMEKACNDWSRAGDNGKSYLKKYCSSNSVQSN